MTESVNVLIISHKHGENVYVNRTIAGYERELLTWVTYYWEDELPEVPMPADAHDRITTYFENVEDESWFVATPDIKE